MINKILNFENLRFIHIPKTGGTSIEHAAKENDLLWGKFDKELKSIKGCRAWHSPQKISGYSFCVIRCPYERIISEFYHQNEIIDYTEENLNKFIQRILSKINRNNYIHDAHFLEQYKFYEYCDIVISFENLETNLNKLMKIFRLPVLKLDYLPGGPKQQSKRNNVQFTKFNKDNINEYNLKLIKEKYHLDFVIWDKVKKNSILFKSNKLELFGKIYFMIVASRRNYDTFSDEEFLSIVKNNIDEICDTFNTRWLISVCDTIADSKTELAPRAMMIVVFVNMIKLWGTDCYLRGKADLNKVSDLQPHKGGSIHELWDGVTTFGLGRGDMFNNMINRYIIILEEYPVLCKIFKTILKRCTDMNTPLKELLSYK